MADDYGIVSSIAGILERTKAQIQVNMQTLNINASGRTSASLAVWDDNKGVYLGLQGDNHAPAETLEVGRAGGKVPAGFYEIIKQWTRDKGLSFGSETERGTFAYFVARKIASEGTQRHRVPVDVYSTPARQAVPQIQQVLADMVYKLIRTDVQTLKTH